jgi:hypothetical protein
MHAHYYCGGLIRLSIFLVSATMHGLHVEGCAGPGAGLMAVGLNAGATPLRMVCQRGSEVAAVMRFGVGEPAANWRARQHTRMLSGLFDHCHNRWNI